MAWAVNLSGSAGRTAESSSGRCGRGRRRRFVPQAAQEAVGEDGTPVIPNAATATAKSIANHALSVVHKDLRKYQARPLLIGLAGPPGSGKSTASKLAQTLISNGEGSEQGLPGVPCGILPMDGFHFSRAQLDRFADPGEAHARRGAPFTFDVDGFVAVLKELRETGQVRSAPGFDHAVGDPTEGAIQIVKGTPVVIIEGNYLFLKDGKWACVQDYLDESWFKDVPINVSLGRVVGRHVARMALSIEEARDRTNKNDRLNAQLVGQTKRHAQFILDSEGCVVKRPFNKPVLGGNPVGQ